MGEERSLPAATVARLPVYLQVLLDAAEAGVATLASDALAHGAGVTAAKVRKDLSYLGSHGTRGVGYEVDGLSRRIARVLGLEDDRSVALIGVGNLGRALASYDGFARRGFHLVALLDDAPEVVGAVIAGREVIHLDRLDDVVASQQVGLAVLAVPVASAQGVADRLVTAGIRSILSFAPTTLVVPDHVTVRRVDLATELQILSFYEQVSEPPGR